MSEDLDRFLVHVGNGKYVIEWESLAWFGVDSRLTTNISKRAVYSTRDAAKAALSLSEERNQ